MDMKNIWNEAFQQFDENTFFSRLDEKVKPQPYFNKYKGFKNTLLALSYVFNIASMLTAMYAVFWLFEWIAGSKTLGIVVALILLFFTENLKRKSSGEVWQIWFFHKKIAGGWLCLSLFIAIASISASMFGTKQATNTLSPTAELIANDSTATAYRKEVEILKTENKELSTQRNHEGIIYHRIQTMINKNKEIINDYTSRILALDTKLEGKNDLLSTEYKSKVDHTGRILAALSLLFEILFEACIAYIWYYYMRSYIERKNTTKNKQYTTPYIKPEKTETIPFSDNKVGFDYRAETIAKQRTETTRNNPPKQLETVSTETAKHLVPQAVQLETVSTETARNNPPKQLETIRETIIVSTPNEDISKLKKYANTYYKRSLKKSSKLSVKNSNKIKYLEYRELLELTGKYKITETPETLIFNEIG